MRKLLMFALLLLIYPLLQAQQTLNNESIIKLVKAGLTEDLIVTTISSSQGTYDTSADGLIALKNAGVSDKVVAAIVARSAPPAVATVPVAAFTTPMLPAGIDEIGVYFLDKSGVWTAVTPEIVNFKTGGFLKSMATDGLVKGDLNGHVLGGHAKTSVTFPVKIAIYVPEGTSIAEYQLLRYRPHSDSREFRSVTGGVFHSSGGASRDSVDFKSDKIAPRLYEITLNSAIGKGEYGLLPPGSYTSTNMASGGKIYSISILE
ncbi:MAG TPA: hypothetical protein VK716_08380 [Terracidiphilus sp.]|jgi:hypothetical protein|nr:hypothetical protein [Terracidiphilus sp.]